MVLPPLLGSLGRASPPAMKNRLSDIRGSVGERKSRFPPDKGGCLYRNKFLKNLKDIVKC